MLSSFFVVYRRNMPKTHPARNMAKRLSSSALYPLFYHLIPLLPLFLSWLFLFEMMLVWLGLVAGFQLYNSYL